MSIKITETITRECCDKNKDLILYKGVDYNNIKYFCKYCGQHFGLRSYIDEAGDTETEVYKLGY